MSYLTEADRCHEKTSTRVAQCFLRQGHAGVHRFAFDLLSEEQSADKIIENQLKEIERLRDGVRFVLTIMYPTYPIDYNVRLHLQDVLDGKDRRRHGS